MERIIDYYFLSLSLFFLPSLPKGGDEGRVRGELEGVRGEGRWCEGSER